MDLSPFTAQKIGITHGVAKVKIVPITVPLPDGGTKQGFATPDAKTLTTERTDRERRVVA